MSNIRDLQKLKVTRKVHEFAQINMKVINQDITSYNYDSITTKVSQQQHKNNKNSQPIRDSFKVIPSKTIHRRGVSFGTPELT